MPPIVIVVGSAKSVPKTVNPVPPAGGPEDVERLKRIRWENSDVFPSGSVAVAEIRAPSSVATARVSSIDALPEASVVTCVEPRYVSPSRNSLGNLGQAELA